MSRWNDPRRDENAEALRRRLAAARSGRAHAFRRPRRLRAPALLVVGLLGAALVLYALG